MKRTKRLLPLILIFALCFTTFSYGAGPGATTQNAPSSVVKDVAAEKQEDLDFLYQSLKEKHPDIFANNSEETFLKKKAEIEAGIATLNDFEFAIELQKLIALIGDSHTTSSLSRALSDYHLFPVTIQYFDGDWVIDQIESKNSAYLGQTVTAINGHSVKDSIQAFSTLFSYDNEIRLRRQFTQNWYIEEMLTAAKLHEAGKDVVLSLRDSSGKTAQITIAPISSQTVKNVDFAVLSDLRSAAPATGSDTSKFYQYKKLNKDTLYIQYNTCREDPNLPMDVFTEQIRSELSSSKEKNVIFDLRYNGGGSDGVLIPLIVLAARLTQEEEATVYCLVGEGTFSSAIINAIELKEAGAILIGSPTGGSVDHFGSVSSFELPNSGLPVSHSTKYIELDTLCAEAAKYGVEPIQPDITAQQTLADYLQGVDTAVNFILKNSDAIGNTIPVEPSGDELLTRGRLVGMLGQTAELTTAQKIPSATDGTVDKGQASLITPYFEDMFTFAWYAPYVIWAKEKGIVSGATDKTFEPCSLVTREEMAVILNQYIQAQKLPLKEKQSVTAFTDASQISSWATSSVMTVQSLGIMNGKPGGRFDPQGTATYSEIKAIISNMAQRVKQ